MNPTEEPNETVADDLRAWLEELEAIERPSASEGEREAAEWMVGKLEELGLEGRIETESAHGTYWWPLGIGTAAGFAGALAVLGGSRSPCGGSGSRGRGGYLRRLAGIAFGLFGAAAIAGDFPPRRRWLRRFLPQRQTYNVVCETGNLEAGRTVVLVSHHDAAHSGLVFHPGIPERAASIGTAKHFDTGPMLMAPVIGGPILALLAGITGSRRLAGLAALLSAGTTATFADIGLRPVVPGANDNGTAVVALLELARRLKADPPGDLRVILLSTGSEESFSEGMKAFGERHFPDLPTGSTFFINFDTLGSPCLTVLRGEGFLKMFDYPADALRLADSSAADLGIELAENLRIRAGTDGLEASVAGYPTVSICSCTDYRHPANYHWPSDVSENVDFDTVGEAIELGEAMTRQLAADWVAPVNGD